MAKEGEVHFNLDRRFRDNLYNWGKEIVKTFVKYEEAQAEAGLKGLAWLAYFKAHLKTRRDWKREEIQRLEPKVQDLIRIINELAEEFKKQAGKSILVVVDDMEKGDSETHVKMQTRLFMENYYTLIQPRFSVIYTLPVYFRGLPETPIPKSQLFSFSAARLYPQKLKTEFEPELDKNEPGYQLMHDFIQNRVEPSSDLFEEGTLDELIRIGGGLFNETAIAVQSAAFHARSRQGKQINAEDVENVFNEIKKQYQPIIRPPVTGILKSILESESGWVRGVEPFLQSRAVVEYENGDIWLDLRYVLKSYVASLKA